MPESVLNPPRGRVSKAASQAVSSGVGTVVTWPDETYDTDGMHAAASGSLVCVTPGTYHFDTYVKFTGTTGGSYRSLYIISGGVFIGRDEQEEPGGGISPTLGVGGDLALSIGAVVQVFFQHDTGSPIDVESGALSWHYVGPTP